MAKRPRDFVHVDEFWEADEHWESYYIWQCVWVFLEEYRAELVGDVNYSRIVIHASDDGGWLFSRGLEDKRLVHAVLANIRRPVSERQLETLGFVRWQGVENLNFDQ